MCSSVNTIASRPMLSNTKGSSVPLRTFWTTFAFTRPPRSTAVKFQATNYHSLAPLQPGFHWVACSHP